MKGGVYRMLTSMITNMIVKIHFKFPINILAFFSNRVQSFTVNPPMNNYGQT